MQGFSPHSSKVKPISLEPRLAVKLGRCGTHVQLQLSEARTENLLLVERASEHICHLTRCLFGSMLRRMEALPVPAG